MKRTIAFLAAALAIMAMVGCNLSLKTNGTSTASSGTMAAYTMFEPADEDELAAAAVNGDVNAGYVIVKVASSFKTATFTGFGAKVVGHFNLGGYNYYRLYKKDGAVKLVASLSKTAGVVYAQHELVLRIPDDEVSSGVAEKTILNSRNATEISSVLNDPMTWGRYGHFETTKAIDAYKAYGVGSNTVYVVDIDTGINRTHEDFATSDGGQIIEYAKSAFESRDGGYTFDFVGGDNPFVDVPTYENWDEEGHGTHTAGTIAAVGNNGVGVAGVAWKNVRLISYKCFSDDASSGSGSDWAVYGGFADLIDWKTTNGITQTIPVNMSLGSSYAGYFELDMINQALSHNIMVVASMGNSGYNAPQYPAAYSGVMAVGATRADGSKVSFSTSGNFISVSAPGYDIYSTYIGGNDKYVDMSGTSMAAPFVTGTVAYLLTFDPTLKPDQLRTIIESTATDIGDSGWDEDTGAGLVNVKAAADLVKNGTIPASGSVYSTKTTKIYVKNTNSNYDSGITGYKTAVIGQPVYIYDSDGDYVCLGLTNGVNGSAEFKMLKPGSYTARTNYLGTMKEKTFKVSNTNDVVLSFDYDIAVLLIQTVPNLAEDPGASTGADTILTVYDNLGNAIAGPYDHGTLDTLSVSGLESGKTYYIGITQYEGATGEYGLNVGFTTVNSVNTTNGRGAGADDEFEDNDTLATAKLITVGTDYGLYQGDADYFYFVMP
jgi:thermitase